MRRILLVLAVFLTFISAASARQAAYTRATALQASLNAALSYWGVPPCGIPQLRPTVLPSMTVGYTYTDAGDDAAADPCYSEIAKWVVNQAPSGPQQFFHLCQVVTHEIGHLALAPDYFQGDGAAFGESDDPHNIMYEYMSNGVTIPSCLAAEDHPFIVGGQYVTVRSAYYPKSGECAAFMDDRRGKRVAMDGWPCKLTDATKP